MKSYQANELDEKTVYKLLSGSIVPRPIAWVTSQNLEGLVNVAPFSFFNVASSNPPLLSISFTGNKEMCIRDSHKGYLRKQYYHRL